MISLAAFFILPNPTTLNWLQKSIHYFSSSDKTGLPYSFGFGRQLNGKTEFNNYANELKKLEAALCNPALLKVISLQCDLFSLGKVYVYDQNGQEVENDPALARLSNPNPFQTQSQFLWDFMFWNMLGNSYCYIDSENVLNEKGKMYFLDPAKMEWPDELKKSKDKLIFSDKRKAELEKQLIKYKYEDGTSIYIPLGKILCINDLTNGTGNWQKGPSRIDALQKVLSNAEHSLDAKNINIRYSAKFLVAGQADPDDVNKMPMSQTEKLDIETKVNGRKQVHAIKSMIDIKRFVSDMGALALDEAYLADYYLIGLAYNIPKDVLEAYTSSTFENQEKARAGHVSYTLQPKGEDLMSGLTRRFGYQDKALCIDWSHLPFMQVFELDKAKTEEVKAKTFQVLVNAGVPLEEINEYLDLKFTKAEKHHGNNQAGSNNAQQS